MKETKSIKGAIEGGMIFLWLGIVFLAIGYGKVFIIGFPVAVGPAGLLLLLIFAGPGVAQSIDWGVRSGAIRKEFGRIFNLRRVYAEVVFSAVYEAEMPWGTIRLDPPDEALRIGGDWRSEEEARVRQAFVETTLAALGMVFARWSKEQELFLLQHPRTFEQKGPSPEDQVKYARILEELNASKEKFNEARDAARQFHYRVLGKLEEYVDLARDIAPNDQATAKSLRPLAKDWKRFLRLVTGIDGNLREIDDLQGFINMIKLNRYW